MSNSNYNKVTINNKNFVFNNRQKLVINNLGEYKIFDYNTGKRIELKSGSIYTNLKEDLPISSAFMTPIGNSITSFKKDHYRKKSNKLSKSHPDYKLITAAEILIDNFNYKIIEIKDKNSEPLLQYPLALQSDNELEPVNLNDKLQLVINENFVIYCRISKEFNNDQFSFYYQLVIEKVYYHGRFIYKMR